MVSAYGGRGKSVLEANGRVEASDEDCIVGGIREFRVLFELGTVSSRNGIWPSVGTWAASLEALKLDVTGCLDLASETLALVEQVVRSEGIGMCSIVVREFIPVLLIDIGCGFRGLLIPPSEESDDKDPLRLLAPYGPLFGVADLAVESAPAEFEGSSW